MQTKITALEVSAASHIPAEPFDNADLMAKLEALVISQVAPIAAASQSSAQEVAGFQKGLVDEVARDHASASGEMQLPHVGNIHNVGWDIPEGKLLQLCRDCLNMANVPTTQWHSLRAIIGKNGLGSSVDVAFVSHSVFSAACTQVDSIKFDTVGGTKLLRLSSKMSDDTRTARKMVHRVHEYVLNSCRDSILVGEELKNFP